MVATRPELLGYAAATLVFVTFSLRSMLGLRLAAIASNVLFIAYATTAGLQPILVLHLVLLPLNLWRLREVLGGRCPERNAGLAQRAGDFEPCPRCAQVRVVAVARARSRAGETTPAVPPTAGAASVRQSSAPERSRCDASGATNAALPTRRADRIRVESR